MKKIVLCLFFVVWAGGLIFAQDIIVTKQSEKIEAKITDVEQDQIKYKKFSYQDGPTYTIKKSDIATIIYQNGDVETFTYVQSTSNTPVPTSSDDFAKGECSHILISSKSLFGGNTSKLNGFVIGEPITGLSDRDIENKIRAGELVFYEDRDFKDYLEKNDKEAYYKLKQGFALQVTGYVFLVTGCALSLSFSLTSMIAGDRDFSMSVALPISGVGLVFAAAVGLPMSIAGRHITNKKVPALYNSHINKGNTTSLSWNVGVTGNGVGFRLNF